MNFHRRIIFIWARVRYERWHDDSICHADGGKSHIIKPLSFYFPIDLGLHQCLICGIVILVFVSPWEGADC